jgi:preprotein translocase subunit Sec61beta
MRINSTPKLVSAVAFALAGILFYLGYAKSSFGLPRYLVPAMFFVAAVLLSIDALRAKPQAGTPKKN